VTDRVAAPPVSRPRHAVPAGACDTHTHVFDARFPNGPSPYALPLATLDVHRAMRATLGCARAVLVQPAPYGRDPACLLDALARDPALRGVMIADEAVTDATLEAWHAAGVRALRFVEMRAPGGTGRYPGAIGIETLDALAPRLRALGWQAHLWATAAQCAAILPRVAAMRVPLVIDHLAMPQGTDDPAFDTLLGHFRDGNAWIKATPCRVPRGDAGYDTLRPLQERLVAANADRVLWGSDWPYVRMEPAPDAGAMLDLFMDWLGDAALARRILVDNPVRLFGFDDKREETTT
jgi:predicted TIM-barrel fold metal-dependent hydrolase